jgi:response regulator NasT
MADSPTVERLRVLIANERQDRLDAVSEIVSGAGHEVTGRLVSIDKAAAATREVDPDLAIVATDQNTEHALDLIGEIVEEATCPVIVLLEASDPEFVADAARLGIFGHVTDADAAELQSAIEIAFRRYEELRGIRGAFLRRALIERAKGILIERHGLDERAAFEMLRDEARRNRVRLAAIADAVLDSQPTAGDRSAAATP